MPIQNKLRKEAFHLKIIIAGSGKVGSTLAEQLSHASHDVTIIDTNEQALNRASDTLDVRCVKGNGASVSALREAGAEHADIIIAVTGMDELNMVCCLTAKRLGTKYSMARIRNVEYTMDQASLRSVLDIDTVINPEYATAVEISRLLRFPAAADIDTFFRGRVELVSFVVQEGDFLAGQPLSALPRQIKSLPVLVCAAEYEGTVTIPNGSFVPKPGCKLYLIGEPLGIQKFFRHLGRYLPKINSVFIVGGGRITHYLASILLRMGVEVKIADMDEDRCRALSEALPHCLIICGDGTDQEFLEAEHFNASDAFVALTNRDEDNLIISLYAMQQGISKAIAKCARQNYASIARSAGLHSIVSPKLITANQILQLVRGMQSSKGGVMTSLYQIAGGKAEAMEFVAGPDFYGLGVPLQDLNLKKGVLIAAIVHEGTVKIPEGSSRIYAGDTVIVISRDQGILNLSDIYASRSPLANGR